MLNALIYEKSKRPDFFELKKSAPGLTFGAWTIAPVSYAGACTTMQGNAAMLFTSVLA